MATDYELVSDALKKGQIPTLTITGTQTRLDSKLSSFAVYILEIKVNNTTLNILRRYNQFLQLSNLICSQWPKETFHDLPKKKFLFFDTSAEKTLITERIQLLQKFLGRLITEKKFVICSDVFIQWLNPQNTPGSLTIDEPDHSGYLLKEGHFVKNWKMRYFILKQDLFYYFRTKTETVPLGVIPLRGATVETAEKYRANCFKITPSPNSNLQAFFIQCENKREFITWVSKLHNAIETYKNGNVPTINQGQRKKPGTEAYVPDELERKESEKETQRLQSLKMQKAEAFLPQKQLEAYKTRFDKKEGQSPKEEQPMARLVDNNSPTKRRVSMFIAPKGKETTNLSATLHEKNLKRTNSQQHGSSEYVTRYKFTSKVNALSTQDLLKQTKQSVDDDLLDFLSTISVAQAKLRFLDQNESKNNENSSSIHLFTTLKNMVIEFIGMDVDNLCLDNNCKRFVQEIQALTITYTNPTQKKYITSLLFIISPFSRLILYQRSYESNRKLPELPKVPKQEGTSNDRTQLTNAILLSTRFIFAAVGISLDECLKNAPEPSSIIMSPAVLRNSNRRASRDAQQLTVNSTEIRSPTKSPPKMSHLQSFSDIHLHHQSFKNTFLSKNSFSFVPEQQSSTPPKRASGKANKSKASKQENMTDMKINLSDSSSSSNSLKKGIEADDSSSSSTLLIDDEEFYMIELADEERKFQEEFMDAKGNIKSVNLSCSTCGEKFQLHQINAHATHCQKLTAACNYSPTGYENELLQKDWDKKLTILANLINEKIQEFYYDKSDKSNEIESLMTIRSILIECINLNSDTSVECHLERFSSIFTEWKENPNDASIFAFAFIAFRLIRDKFKDSSVIPKPTPSKITMKSFEIVKQISRGAFGRVDLVQRIGSDELFAMKTLNKDDMIAKNLVDQVMVERNILATIENPYVVKLFHAFHNKSRLYLIMEYLPGGDCAALLENIGCFDEQMAKLYIAETIMALDYLHSRNIIHRDVKPDNFLISADGHIKLTDFGLSLHGLMERNHESLNDEDNVYNKRRSVAPSQKVHRVVGTPDYLAPEALIGTGCGKPTIDWWAVGVTLFEFLTGIPPFNDETPEKIFQHIISGDIPWPGPEDMSDEAVDLISKLLDPDPNTRLGAKGVQEIQKHPFFKDIDWDNLYLEPRHSTFVPRVRDRYDTGYFVPRNNLYGNHGDSFVSSDDDKDDSFMVQKEASGLWAGFSFSHLPISDAEREELKRTVQPPV